MFRGINVRRRFLRRVLILRRFFRLLRDRILKCCFGKSIQYHPLPRSSTMSTTPSPATLESGFGSGYQPSTSGGDRKSESDLVDLKISLLGDCQIGKTSFLVKYVGDEEKEQGGSQEKGLNSMDKTLFVKGARISYSIWEVDGDSKAQDQIPTACKDSVAIMFMFDLTSRCTLNNIISWYQQARKWNQAAIPILIGTKFDDFIQLPIDLQWTIASQARSYARAMNATLFFSSATYNINVNKIFKFITAKLFDLPWTVERNLTIGEPIIDF